ncbi:MAG: class I SAM-dependent methyltransferase [Thermoanaerobaculia bacterium]
MRKPATEISRGPIAAFASRAKQRIEKLLGYRRGDWLRERQVEDWMTFLKARSISSLRCLEISPAPQTPWAKLGFQEYTSTRFPEFDICVMCLDSSFDVVIADQVLEHVVDPVEAVRNCKRMLTEGGWLLVAAPFLFRVHGRPRDFTRWTADGLSQLFVKAGFSADAVVARSWGNRACARAHIGSSRVLPYGFWRPMQNEDEYPVMSWAFGQNRT